MEGWQAPFALTSSLVHKGAPGSAPKPVVAHYLRGTKVIRVTWDQDLEVKPLRGQNWECRTDRQTRGGADGYVIGAQTFMPTHLEQVWPGHWTWSYWGEPPDVFGLLNGLRAHDQTNKSMIPIA
jgi:hypothetical protein